MNSKFDLIVEPYPRTSTGFTLVELMITISIIGILAAVSYPSYRDSILRSNRTEGKAMLMDASSRQERWFSDNGTYTTTLANVGFSNPADSDNGYYRLTAAAGTTGSIATSHALTVTVQGKQADDTDCNTLTLNSLGQKSATGNNATECW